MDRNAVSYGYTLAGEHALQADRLRREAHKLREQAAQLEAQAEREQERAEWARELADALNPHEDEDE